jgi:hypothetical protein
MTDELILVHKDVLEAYENFIRHLKEDVYNIINEKDTKHSEGFIWGMYHIWELIETEEKYLKEGKDRRRGLTREELEELDMEYCLEAPREHYIPEYVWKFDVLKEKLKSWLDEQKEQEEK